MRTLQLNPLCDVGPMRGEADLVAFNVGPDGRVYTLFA